MREQRIVHLGAWVKSTLRRIWERLRDLSPRERRVVSAALGLLVVAVLAVAAIAPRITNASEMSALANGGFEHGFKFIPGCGEVGAQWECFTNGGAANYGFYDDQWDAVVAEGKHSQLIEINTKGLAAGDNDRYAGIYQTARVVPGAKYKLSLRGMIRTTNKEGDPWRYSVQVGWLNGPHGDWRDVDNWTDVGWNTYYDREEPSAFSGYETILMPDAEVVTVFIRVWKKWGVAYEELDVNLDEIALVGPSPKRDMPDKGPDMPMGGSPGTGGPVAPMPMGPSPMDKGSYMDGGYPVACGGPDLLYNGSFEQGFAGTAYGDVGRGWEAFTNGGAVNYGFYQEQWDVVVADGRNGQLIEISSKGVFPTDGDRYAGIYQRLDKLQPGAVYELTLRGLLRGEGNEEEPYRFAAQAAIGASPDWRHIDSDDWHELDLGPIYKRTEPGPLAQVKVRFKAPAPQAVLFIRGWNKWGVTNVEMDLNLDAISLRACDQGGPSMGGPNQGDWSEKPMGGTGGPMGASCLYIVKPGDTLSQIAQMYDVDAAAIMRANGIDNGNLIYVGQKFEIPGCAGGDMGKPVPMPEQPMPEQRMPDQARPEQRMPEQPMPDQSMPDDRSKGGDPMMMAPEQLPMPQMGPSPTARTEEPVRPTKQGIAKYISERTYTVQAGDMLSQIAADYDVNVYDLALANGLDNMNFIYAGQVLLIP